MEETSKAIPKKGIVFAAVIVLLAAAVIFAALRGGEKAPEGTGETRGGYEMEYAQPEQETLPPVRVEMPDYELSYSGALQDVIVLEEQPDTGDLAFSVSLSEGKVPIFTLSFNSDQGDYVTVLQDAAGNQIPVAFRMEKIPEDLSEEDHALFCTAQDAVNEIVDSLILK